ncbi:MAG: hypothetical protein A2504_08560 [Bdellovibrionales bacterium RIFOXYD12_FULL_39_22]|nr:MAG: hypothetical protein A2385_01785 [Bdellovibrionales bacterium RIFOXYB1_FULL_39_21]OFZ42908.1 MAG: hypothetical protein A2485_10590 [Bdellovibrionales bacterium RIFOXYC12_FULL_39_17]OFZ47521.1 MAG: hypothetical protein A2404_14705 [Bdellovibrionales bacterium RIFOXYC1_FULL_39_130]OFZ75609.1 MAG: hypothetical protein A2560_14855 [Bdellovibrionales bacterium RIFOXYD1_FULL_39_84]OFZ93932.1 MAG: hypothetical protein A2504_08560 [Bdellovibrionales bacterium RIFOXYD12_FULL_39_22]
MTEKTPRPLLVANNVKKSFDKVNALNGVTLTLFEGDQYVIRGASGCGKSTLLYLMGGLDRPTSGSVVVNGQDLSQYDDDALAKFRNTFTGLVFQFHFLLPSMNCLNNILLPARIAGVSLSNIKENCQEFARELGVDHCLAKYPFQLSGGEQQRINIIRALSLRPKLLLCDEPTGNLDRKNGQNVTRILLESAKHFGATLVVVTHDQNVSSHFKNELVMEDGRLIADSRNAAELNLN